MRLEISRMMPGQDCVSTLISFFLQIKTLIFEPTEMHFLTEKTKIELFVIRKCN